MKKFTLLFFLFFSSILWSAATDVQSIHYVSKKTSTIGDQVITSEMLVWMVSHNVRLSITSPEKRDLILNGDVVGVFTADEALQTQNYTDVPPVIRQLLVPSIFSAGTFMQNIEKGFTPKLQKKEKNLAYYSAESKKKKNLSRIDYIFDTKNNTLVSYKMYYKTGALFAEVYFFDYKLFNNTLLLPLRIRTLTTLKEGVLNDEEIFSRVKVNAPIDSSIFQLKGGDK
jgi:hypothetical protein